MIFGDNRRYNDRRWLEVTSEHVNNQTNADRCRGRRIVPGQGAGGRMKADGEIDGE